MRDIIYLHGFASSGNSFKGVMLREEFGLKANTPSLFSDPLSDINSVKDIISKLKNPLLIGSSLGGFYAEFLSKTMTLDAILINPLTNVLDIKPYIGKHKYFEDNREFEFTNRHFEDLIELQNQLGNYRITEERRVVLVAKDDTTISYLKSLKHFVNENEEVIVYNTGGHSFNNREEILKHINSFL